MALRGWREATMAPYDREGEQSNEVSDHAAILCLAADRAIRTGGASRERQRDPAQKQRHG
jgi:hypothetical protein